MKIRANQNHLKGYKKMLLLSFKIAHRPNKANKLPNLNKVVKKVNKINKAVKAIKKTPLKALN